MSRQSKKLIFSTFIISVIYLFLVVYLRNFVLVNDTFFSPFFSISAKLKLYDSLFVGMATSMTYLSLFLIFVTAILTGLNITLVIQKLNEIRELGKMHLVAGGSTLVGIVGGGCASCGLPVISILGLGQSLVFLPFKGAELPYLSIILLLFSLYFLVRSDRNAKFCEIK